MSLQNAFGNLSTEEKQDAILTELQKKVDGNETQPVEVINPTDVSLLAKEAKQLPDNHRVEVSNQPTGFATSAKQLPDGHNVTILNPTANPETGLAKESKQLPDNHQVTVSNQLTGFATEAKQDTLLIELQKKADGNETQPVSLASQPLPDGASTAANQTNGTQRTQIVDNANTPITSDDGKLDVMADLIPIFRQMLMLMANPGYVDKSLNAERNYVTGGALSTVTTVTTVSIVTTVTNLTNFGSQSADVMFRMNSVLAWSNNVRPLIT